MEETDENINSKYRTEDFYRNQYIECQKQLSVYAIMFGRLRGIAVYLCGLIDRSGDDFMKGIAQKIMVDIENFENIENYAKERLEKLYNTVDNPK